MSDYFEVLGMDRRLQLDEAELQKKFYALSRQWHPDRYTQKSTLEQQQALDATALINDAYRTLRDPIKRAEYVLGSVESGKNEVPPELLEEVFELNMAIEESDRPQLEAARDRFASILASGDTELKQAFLIHDEAAEKTSALRHLRALLNKRRYIENLTGTVAAALA